MKSYFVKALLYSIAISLLIVLYTSYRDFIHTKASTVFLTSSEYLVTNSSRTITDVSKGSVAQKKENTKAVTPNVKHVFHQTNVQDATQNNQSLKYILQWTSDKNVPFVDMGKGQSGFIDRNCSYTNCFVTSDKNFLMGDYTKFHAIAFSGPDLSQRMAYHIKLPEKRSVHQKYVFASIESSDNYKICSKEYDGVFNWTWTYKLDSELQWGYIVIRNMRNNIIGPKLDMEWLKLENMDPVTEDFKNKLKTKKKAAAWFVSNCFSKNRREVFVRELQMELKKYNHVIDIYGSCGTFVCSRDNKEECDKKIAKNYYFYLSFENSFSEDYVTEKLLLGLNNNAVPVVYGLANYTRFMPDGIYLNARELGVRKLAAKMNELINNPEEYADFFRWKNHYRYHRTTESVESNEYCKMCELLNDNEALETTTVYNNLKDWWNPKNSTCSTF